MGITALRAGPWSGQFVAAIAAVFCLSLVLTALAGEQGSYAAHDQQGDDSCNQEEP